MKEVLIALKSGLKCAALFEEGRLYEYLQEDQVQVKTGNIYRAQVSHTVKELNAAFALLPGQQTVYIEQSEQKMKPGNMVMIQIKREAFDSKYPLAVSRLSLTGKRLVVTLGERHINLSKKIIDPAEKQRLQRIISHALELERQQEIGVIIRTAAQGVPGEALEQELYSLIQRLQEIRKAGAEDGPPKLLYDNSDFLNTIIREKIQENTESVLVGDLGVYQELETLFSQQIPQYLAKLRLVQGEFHLFDLYNVDAEMRKAMSRKIWLNSGAYIIIDKTEALTVIDVNSGKYDKREAFETMASKINLEAAAEIARLLRVRNIGGIIIVDFLKMRETEANSRLLTCLKDALKEDKAKPVVAGMTRLGLVELTRKRM